MKAISSDFCHAVYAVVNMQNKYSKTLYFLGPFICLIDQFSQKKREKKELGREFSATERSFVEPICFLPKVIGKRHIPNKYKLKYQMSLDTTHCVETF